MESFLYDQVSRLVHFTYQGNQEVLDLGMLQEDDKHFIDPVLHDILVQISFSPCVHLADFDLVIKCFRP